MSSPRPVIKAKRWWWLPDRKKAKLLNQVQQYMINQEIEQKILRYKGIIK